MVDAVPQSFEYVLSSMCTEPHPDARIAANRFLATNPGDPASYPEIATIESEVVDRLGDIVGLPEPSGYVTSGGTEANIQAVRIARNRADVDDPNVVIPENGHFSFRKAAELLGVEFRPSPVDDDHRAAVDAMADRIDEQTILVAGVAGSTEYGRVDPIPAIAALADEHDLHCHVDAAWGGFLLPFTDEDWHFGHAAIDSMTIDPHKFGRAAIPAGGLLVRTASQLDALLIETPYLESGHQITLGGTRSGAGVASAAAALAALWPTGYEDQYRTADQLARWLADQLRDRGHRVVDPHLPIVAASIEDDTFAALRDRGWRIARTARGELRIVCMPHVTRARLAAFLADLDAVQ